ncbi:hypothetical protein NEISICOT_02392 [Neisseria sicca ATCC 29256]|uniref:Uncharacterized protein n=1 Tax=Neisseria sicca ATCC 29256 TaxID=547045 RepID=C6M785_NEISI|nr:hypothetical protein NEISICOT_02392 [Neisseria sicca ATCC 29256]
MVVSNLQPLCGVSALLGGIRVVKPPCFWHSLPILRLVLICCLYGI